eukprot:comp12091_c0_seq1/m.6824 comp12091_c0_seq1/g.6824  ORF comp12091_c0_seq1/g.6824 comp12091_c0_seq1/m.6824 type:complete len:339 (-) comp12091_c0_seq1:711-1727(-)
MGKPVVAPKKLVPPGAETRSNKAPTSGFLALLSSKHEGIAWVIALLFPLTVLVDSLTDPVTRVLSFDIYSDKPDQRYMVYGVIYYCICLCAVHAALHRLYLERKIRKMPPKDSAALLRLVEVVPCIVPSLFIGLLWPVAVGRLLSPEEFWTEPDVWWWEYHVLFLLQAAYWLHTVFEGALLNTQSSEEGKKREDDPHFEDSFYFAMGSMAPLTNMHRPLLLCVMLCSQLSLLCLRVVRWWHPKEGFMPVFAWGVVYASSLLSATCTLSMTLKGTAFSPWPTTESEYVIGVEDDIYAIAGFVLYIVLLIQHGRRILWILKKMRKKTLKALTQQEHPKED